VFEMAAPIQSPAKCEVRMGSALKFLTRYAQEGDEFLESTVTGDGDFHLFLHPKEHLAGKKFDDDDEVQEEIMTWFKRQEADFYDSGYRSWFQDLINVWTMPAIVLKNKVMYRQFIHSVAFVN